MPRIAYPDPRLPVKFSKGSLEVIAQANAICAEYRAQGFDLTLRQLYYQFVSRDLIANKDTEYKRLGNIVNQARLAGLLDWNYIVDRTRNLRALGHWTSPADIIGSAAASFRTDRWASQKYRPEVWIEKDALVGVIEGVCERNDVPYFSCRGYTSQSEVWAAGQRLARYIRRGQTPIIFHLGDHDPSGKDMTRDITDRLELFMGGLEVDRLALNWEQIELYEPPPNPAKLTDSRAEGYIQEYGDESWELDALAPTVIDALIQDAIDNVRDEDAWEYDSEQDQAKRDTIQKAADNWEAVAEYVASL